uniref:Uncharacterized protein n=1 Tax=Rhizophora mucronata TaxID=61149 RepID=A0A2P2QHK5_RHIMU
MVPWEHFFNGNETGTANFEFIWLAKLTVASPRVPDLDDPMKTTSLTRHCSFSFEGSSC